MILISITLGLSDPITGLTVTSKWARWRLKSSASPLLTHLFIQTQIIENIKAPHHWPLCDRWIPCTNGQWLGKCFQLMTSLWMAKLCMYRNAMVIPHPLTYTSFRHKILRLLYRQRYVFFTWMLQSGDVYCYTLWLQGADVLWYRLLGASQRWIFPSYL